MAAQAAQLPGLGAAGFGQARLQNAYDHFLRAAEPILRFGTEDQAGAMWTLDMAATIQ